ncbi:MAG TPA: NAD-dependent epimerase/dehydratase family protein [Planctomycetota bacterium]|nr:NAD-dependent epimerase/dehydratase family protein [Planctomycetota bacterium]
MTSTLLVTGASGFIGSHVTRAARDAGWRVVALVRPTTERAGRASFEGETRAGDLRDEKSLERALEGVDAVVHLAGLTRAKSRKEFFDANAGGVARLVRAARRTAPRLKRFVYVSSLAAGGPSLDGRPVREDDPPRPVSDYGRSKLAGEEELRREAGELPWTIVRPPIVYGPEERDLFEIFKAARGGFVPVVGSGAERYSILHGEDLARLLVSTLGRERGAGKIYYAAEPDTYTHRELIGHCAAAVGATPRLLPVPRWLACVVAAGGSAVAPFRRRPPLITLGKLPEVLAPGWTCDASAAARDFDFAPRYRLPEGARATADWYREKGWL